MPWRIKFYRVHTNWCPFTKWITSDTCWGYMVHLYGNVGAGVCFYRRRSSPT